MGNDRKGREDSLAVCVSGETILYYGAEPAEESELRDVSPSSLVMRLVITRWGLSLGGGASQRSTGAFGVWRWALSVGQMSVQGPVCSSARSMLFCI